MCPVYFRRKNARGLWEMVEQREAPPVKPEPIVMPLTSTVGDSVGFKRYCCTACTPAKPFSGRGIAAMHFSKKHADLKQDKDTWRQYIKEFGNI